MENRQRVLIGEVISVKRNEFKLTQREVANKIGLSRSYLADVEAGRYCPSVKSLVLIASALEIDLNFLFTMVEYNEGSKGGYCIL